VHFGLVAIDRFGSRWYELVVSPKRWPCVAKNRTGLAFAKFD
jgi:hypothetical protein